MKKTRVLFTIMLVLAVSCSFSQSKNDALEADIRELMELTGAGELGKQVADNLINQYKSVFPDISAEIWEEYRSEFKSEDLVDLVIPIYAKYYTAKEVRKLIKFYKTPLGRKTIEVLPDLMQDSMEAGQKWGIEIQERLTKRLQEKGYMN